MIQTWHCNGFDPVLAHTKGEARALFKKQAQRLENLTFHPRKLTRLPAGARVEQIKSTGTVKDESGN